MILEELAMAEQRPARPVSEGKDIAIGAPVELAWNPLSDGSIYPAFRIA
jgi:hypothetical protein